MKCPLFIPPGNSYTPGDDFPEAGSCRARDDHVEVASIEPIDLNNTGSRIHMPQVKPAEMTNLEYQDGGQSAFSMDK